ncbi:hypothetical protein TARUN_8570, partial [Trichoderma arundinaceum]
MQSLMSCLMWPDQTTLAEFRSHPHHGSQTVEPNAYHGPIVPELWEDRTSPGGPTAAMKRDDGLPMWLSYMYV